MSHQSSILDQYTNQPSSLPVTIREKMEQAIGREPIQLYAFADLNSKMQSTDSWVGVSPSYFVVYESESGNERILSIKRREITKVKESIGLSSTTLHLLTSVEKPAFASIRYSHRQKTAMAAIVFILEHPDVDTALAEDRSDQYYADAVSDPILKAQGNVTQSKLSVLWRLVAYLAPYKFQFAAGFASAVMLTLMMLVPPWLTRRILNEAFIPFNSGRLEQEAAFSLSMGLIALLAGSFVFREVFAFIRLRTLAIVGEKVARDLRKHIYDHLHKLSISFFSRNQTGTIISRVGSDTDRIWDFIAFCVPDVLFAGILVVGLSSVLLTIDWVLGLILILPIPLLFWLIYSMGKQLHRVFLRIWHRWSQMTGVVGDTIPGIRVVQAFNQEDRERKRFDDRNEQVLDEAIAIHRIWTNRWPIIYLGINSTIVIVWFFAIPRVLGSVPGWEPLEIGDFIAFQFYMGMFVMPLEQFGFLTRMINRSISSAHRVFEILDTHPEIVECSDPVKLDPVEGNVEFENVTFGYDPVRQILKGISFDVKAGEMIGLVGPSGAGKTTVINLIARFYDVNSGTIRIDGVDIRNLDVGGYRSQIGMVMQDPYLFHGTILENIRYGFKDANLEQVVAAAKAANAHDFILKLPQSYDTWVGERGHTLSGGERQRISIARAILHNPRVLILDEATSSVDTETEKKIQEAIDRLISGRTVFAIAHRLSTLSRASRLFVMKDGLIVEKGTHQELLSKPDGLYTKLHNIQQQLHNMYAV
jgi:ATP-binding cassette subfamily B protein